MDSLYRIGVIFKKEVKDFFWSPLFYILTGVYSLIMGWLFYNYLVLSKDLTNLSLSIAVLRPIFGNMNFLLLFLIPLITMRTFSGEWSRGTLDLLFMTKVKDYELIIGKLLSVLFVVCCMISSGLIFPGVLAFSGFQDWGIVFTSFIGVILCALSYISVGLFCSSLTKNSMVSAILSIGFLMGIILLVYSGNASSNIIIKQIAMYIGPAFHFEFLTRGTLNSFGPVYFFSFTFFFLTLTKLSLERRSWS